MIQGKVARFLVLGASLFLLSGCASAARGVTEAILDHKSEDTRQCEIEGRTFTGVRASLEQQNATTTTKVLMVHGVGQHQPGYSNHFRTKLLASLGLDVTDHTVKNIEIVSPDVHWEKDEPHTIGNLRITRHADVTGKKDLVFYELTWSDITQPQKDLIEYDSAGTEGLKRATVNGALKMLMNKTVPDMLIYEGNGHEKITAAVSESVCWMFGDTWAQLPTNGAHQCAAWPDSQFDHVAQDNFFFVTHSLGSRITIDTIQALAQQKRNSPQHPHIQSIKESLRGRDLTVFMMANQLPLLQMGAPPPAIADKINDYCGAKAPLAKDRLMKSTTIVAFSDPNDILSYPVPTDYAHKNIDSRTCPEVINVSLNVATERGLLGANSFSFADPATAHSGYHEDDRVISLISDGISRNNKGKTVAGQRCQWTEVRD